MTLWEHGTKMSVTIKTFHCTFFGTILDCLKTQYKPIKELHRKVQVITNIVVPYFQTSYSIIKLKYASK